MRIDLQRNEGGSQATVRVKRVSGECKESRKSLFTYDLQREFSVTRGGGTKRDVVIDKSGKGRRLTFQIV